MTTDQIAAEAARRYIRKLDLPRSVRPQAVMDLTYEIKSAIEKASQIERERADLNADIADSIARASKQTEDALRQQIFELCAAHASEQGCTITKEDYPLIDCGDREHCYIKNPRSVGIDFYKNGEAVIIVEKNGIDYVFTNELDEAIDAAMRKET